MSKRVLSASILILAASGLLTIHLLPDIIDTLELDKGSYKYGQEVADLPEDMMSRTSCPNCSVILISIDTLRADRLGCYGYHRDTSPNMDELAKDSMIFTNHYTVVTHTGPSHASMFTSKRPYEIGMPSNGYDMRENQTTIASVLNGYGYKTHGISATYALKRSKITQGFESFDTRERQVNGKRDRRASTVTNNGIEWLEGNRDGRFFLFLHYFDPHTPYMPPPEHDIFSSPAYKALNLIEWGKKKIWEPGSGWKHHTVECAQTWGARHHCNARYDGEVRYTDHEVGRLIDYARDTGMLEDTVFIITSDHGESLSEHGFYEHNGPCYEETIKIPLMIHSKGVGGRVGWLTDNMQMMPTIFELIGVPNDVTPIGSVLTKDAEKTVITENHGYFTYQYAGVRTLGTIIEGKRHPWEAKTVAGIRDGMKYMMIPREDSMEERAYDRGKDKLEEDDVFDSIGSANTVADIRGKTMNYRQEMLDHDHSLQLSDYQTIQRLRALGYIQ
ncbi:sulfatase [Candidatus Altiarchaeota archaeon]